jgi:glycosyltransferase involved in cell wall biosynthesis
MRMNELTAPSDSPLIGIIVPLFAHSVLVADALAAALGQSCRHAFTVVVINDGCRFVESDLRVKSILSVHPRKIHYLVQSNSGLSAARNTGIDYLMSQFASLQAVYFLDADNAIRPKAIESAYDLLLDHPDADWIYPNIDMFGVRRYFDYGGPYSPLMHTRYNICEAGSLVHRRVFDAGVRFDENMKLGFEDWDFWLSAAGRGFRGHHHPQFGFQYRNRAESMLSQSKRDEAAINAYLQAKHRTFVGPRNVARLEQAEAPRYAVLFTDTHDVLLVTDVYAATQEVPQSVFDETLWRNIIAPNWQHVPPIFVFMTRAVYAELKHHGLLPWVLYDGERTLRNSNFCCVTVNRSTALSFAVINSGTTRDCSILALGRDLIRSIILEKDTAWIEGIQTPDAPMKVANKALTVPLHALSASAADGSLLYSFLLRILAWRSSPYRAAAQTNWMWREASIPARHALVDIVRDAFAGEVVYPAVPAQGRNIGFALSIASFGGVERVAHNVAKEFARTGWKVHLFVIGGTRIEMPAEFAGVATTINFVDEAIFMGWDSRSQYQGTALPASGRISPLPVNQLIGLLGWLDVIVNCHSGALNAAAASLRRLGVRTIMHLHLLDQTVLGRSVGHPMMGLAYEHAYDVIVCNSAQLMNWMHASGIPREKLVLVPNAPGHSIDPATRARYEARRRAPEPRLNVLYLGRLDRQKGMERVDSVIDRSRRQKLPINWRVIGAGVTDGHSLPPLVARCAEPAVLDRDSLLAAYDWADVMVLLSDYEGVPLSVLEARRAGVVVIATNVGAVAEIIESGRTGFLLDLDGAVEECVEVLSLLCRTPNLRPVIAAAASRVPEWAQTTAEFIERVTDLVDGSLA